MKKKPELVIVTGAAGYIGSVVCGYFLSRGFNVVGVDNLTFGARSLNCLMAYPGFQFEHLDVTAPKAMNDCLMRHRPTHAIHLAAIVGDPACKAAPELARRINLQATQEFYQECADAGVYRFIFASTCSNYGLSASDEMLSETSPLNPVSLYAECKVTAEEWLLNKSRQGGPKTFVLRFSTAHGLSPRMRFDLTVNEFAKTLLEGSALEVYDATTWRPYCHVVDFGRVIFECLSNTSLNADNYVLNVGSDAENFRKIDIIDKIVATIPGGAAQVRNIGDGRDRRNYRVSFQKLNDLLGMTPLFTVDKTIDQIACAIRAGVFKDTQAIYTNI